MMSIQQSCQRIKQFAMTNKALLASLATIVALALFAMQQALRLPAGYGIEDFMGWSTRDEHAASIGKAVEYWSQLAVLKHVPSYYLLLDTLLFIPLYSLLIYGATAALHARFQTGDKRMTMLGRIAPWLLLVLVLDDLAENLSGFAKLGMPLPGFFGANANLFNAAKFPLLFAALLPALYLVLAWWMGFLCSTAAVQLRREKWQGIKGVIGRSRYVLAALALFAGFTIVMDQCRDVVLSMVADDMAIPTRVAVITLNAVAGAMFAYSCFLWTRLVCMVQRTSLPPFSTGAVTSSVGYFAQQWARFLALLPALAMVILLDYVTGDAIAGLRMRAQHEAADASAVLIWLSFFVALVVVLCGLFVWVRQRLSMENMACYYNAMGVESLLKAPTRLPPGVPRILQPLANLLQPTILPLFALALLLLLRLAPVFDWKLQPLAFAELCLSLTWWLGVAGLLSLIEQRTSMPWGLILLVAVGVLGLLDVTNNHQLSQAAGGAVADKVVEFPALVGALVILLLGIVWLLLTRRHLAALGSTAASGGLLFLGYVVLLVAMLVGALSFAEHASTPATMLAAKVQRPALIEQLNRRAGTGKTLYLVAAEGGGIRSAYWTALMLARLHDAPPGEAAGRVLVVSGVSGGALGAAAYRACLRQAPLAVKDCIHKGFANFDPLSPMLESLMMEDVLARIVPTPPRSVPGYGYLSRALPFERAWIAAFPAMAEPLSPARQGEPELMLNSTAVETGNRNTFSTVKLEPDQIPANNDIVAELGHEPRLVTAAHAAARFPFINPLALAHGPTEADFRHLADGGYYDNSGVIALADLMPTIRQRYPDNPIRLILIRNGQAVASCEKKHLVAPRPECLMEQAVVHEAGDDELKLPLKSPGQKFYADALGPPAALFHVSGTGAHGRYPAAGSIWDNHDIHPCTLDQERTVNLVPLGWYLSDIARLALEKQAEKVDLSACLEVSPPSPSRMATSGVDPVNLRH